MKLDNRITLSLIVLIILVMVIQPCVLAQGGGRGGRGGDNRGDMMGPGGRGGDNRGDMPGGGRDMGGRGGGRGMFQDEPVTDAQIDRIMKLYSTRHSPQEAKSLEDQRKNLGREQFIWTLRGIAWQEYFEVIREEGEYKRILEWCEEYTPDEAKGIKELKDDNYDLYKKKLDPLYNKYRQLIERRPQPSKELMQILVSDLQLELKERDLTRQYWMTSDQKKKESIYSDLKDVISQRYTLIVKQKELQYTELQKQLARLQESVNLQLKDIEKWKDPASKENETLNRLNNLTKMQMPNRRGGPFGQSMPFYMRYPGMPGTPMGPNSIPEPNK